MLETKKFYNSSGLLPTLNTTALLVFTIQFAGVDEIPNLVVIFTVLL